VLLWECWVPVADGNARIQTLLIRLQPIRAGLTLHGLRHSHKTWMIDDGIGEIAQAPRLGHILGDKVRETCSHVAAAMKARLLAALQTRWEKAVADRPADAPLPAGANSQQQPDPA
jgi:integrase